MVKECGLCTMDAMTHQYKATEIYRKKKRQQNVLILKQILHINENLLLKKLKSLKRNTDMRRNQATSIKIKLQSKGNVLRH